MSSPCDYGSLCEEIDDGYICSCNITCDCFTDTDILDDLCRPGEQHNVYQIIVFVLCSIMMLNRIVDE